MINNPTIGVPLIDENLKPGLRPRLRPSLQWWHRGEGAFDLVEVKKICEFLRRCSPSGHHHPSVISRTCSNISRTYFYDTQFFILLGPVFVASFAQSSLAGSVQA